MLTDNKGIIKLAFVFLLVLVGVMVWVYVKFWYQDLSKVSIKFDSHLSNELVRHGITDASILEQYVKEKSIGTYQWIEYYKKIEVPEKTNLAKLLDRIDKIAAKYNLDTFEEKYENQGILLKVKGNKKLFSEILFIYSIHTRRTVSGKNKVAIIIDDVGYRKDISDFINLGIPLTFAILPREPYSTYHAKQLKKQYIPFIMHLPLEPNKYPEVDPGEFALLLNMDNATVEYVFEKNIESLPGAAGVSNHMGSRFSESERSMENLLRLVKKHNLFYFDSNTTSKSKSITVGKKLGLKVLKNNVFLDGKNNYDYITGQLNSLLKRAKKRKYTIAIGHIQNSKNLVPALKDFNKKFKNENIELVYLPELYN